MAEKAVSIRQLSLLYNDADSETSARDLVYEVRPNWKTDPGSVEIVRFTGGIMNALLKITKQSPVSSALENEKGSILLRAYGKDSDILIDREMEATTHVLLAEKGFAPPLIARFRNGLLYGFLPGQVCSPQDLREEPIWRAIAARLGEWHAQLPLPDPKVKTGPQKNPEGAGNTLGLTSPSIPPSRTIWSVLEDWVAALPAKSKEERSQRKTLKDELQTVRSELTRGGEKDLNDYVMGHCDLLSANVIISDSETDIGKDGISDSFTESLNTLTQKVHFIDYEYAVPCPAAFDLANHFSEWGGYDCDYNMLPTQATRRSFIDAYMRKYNELAQGQSTGTAISLEDLCREVDRYRGMPGFYWGVQALIQNTISDVDFDWASYAEVRLAEFWAWRGEVTRTRAQAGKEMPLRERRWAQRS